MAFVSSTTWYIGVHVFICWIFFFLSFIVDLPQVLFCNIIALELEILAVSNSYLIVNRSVFLNFWWRLIDHSTIIFEYLPQCLHQMHLNLLMGAEDLCKKWKRDLTLSWRLQKIIRTWREITANKAPISRMYWLLSVWIFYFC